MTVFLKNSKEHTKALTLIEVLIGISIFAIISVSLYSSFRMGLTSYRRTESYWQANQKAMHIADMIAKDIKNSFAYSDEDSRFTGSPSSLSFFCLSDSYSGYFPETNISLVKYEFLSGNLTKVFAYGGESFKEGVLEYKRKDFSIKIKNFSLRYGFRSEADSKELSWKNSWEPSKEEPMPYAIEVSISVQDDYNAKVFDIKRIVLIKAENV